MTLPGRSAKVSGYLSIFDDWDILPEALASMADLVDEIVVVDGAYEWIVPFLGGRAGDRSRDEVYDALAPYGSKVRLINRTWTDEAQKRRAGYEACSHRYILRHDADEVFFPEPDCFERFVGSGKAVGQIEMPIYLTPDFSIEKDNGGRSLQGALFDSDRIGATAHLDYLWLVLPNHIKQSRPESALIAAETFSQVAHLTSWRTPATSVSRANFYVMLYLRNGGAFPLTIEELTEQGDFRDILLGHQIVAGPPHLDNSVVAAAPLGPAQRASLKPLYNRFHASLARLNADLAQGRPVIDGTQYAIDITTPEARRAAGSVFRFDAPLNSCHAMLHTCLPTVPYVQSRELDVVFAGDTARLDIPETPGSLQSTVVIVPHCAGGRTIRIRSAGPDHTSSAG